MPDVWFISDTHMGHDNILKFTKDDGTLVRPGFKDLHEMHARIIENWCRTVKNEDKVYHLGDVAFKLDALGLLRGLPGKKRLVRGNHDGFKITAYQSIFQEIYGVRQIDGFWLTHVPMHPQSLEGRAKANIHGHLHHNVVTKHLGLKYTGQDIPDPRYFNACVEHHDYTPVNFDTIKAMYK